MTSPSSTASPARLDFLDAIRFAAMAFMVQGHTLDALVRTDELNITQSPWWIWHALRGLTAPLFLLLSGMVGTLSLKRGEDGRVPVARLQRRVLWGLGLMALGYLLVFPANRIADLRWLSPDVWRSFLQVNILQLNGLVLILTTLVAGLTRSDRAYGWASLGIAGLFVLVAPGMQGIDWFGCLPEAVASYLSPTHGSLFPLFPHGAFLFLGAAIGVVLKGLSPSVASARFLKLCFLGGIGALALAPLFGWVPGVPPKDPFGVSPTFTLVRLGLVLLLMTGLAWAILRLPRVAVVAGAMGRHSLKVYVGHLLLLYGLPWVHGMAQGRYRAMTLAEGFGAVAFVGSLTFGGVLLLEYLQRRNATLHALLRLSSATWLAWALLF